MNPSIENSLSNNSSVSITDDFVQSVPQEALESIDLEAKMAGGEWQLSPEHEGCVGWTMYDMPNSEDNIITVLLPKEKIQDTPRQALVRIKSLKDERNYLGAIVKGPFAEPDGIKADAPVVITATVKGGLFLPQYHGRINVEIIGEELQDAEKKAQDKKEELQDKKENTQDKNEKSFIKKVIPPRRRPLPNSPVFILDKPEAEQVLKIGGEIRLGLADSYEDLEIKIPVKKSVFPRHLGILGTTGGGKSTTVSGIIAQFQKADMATILLDTEGEYTHICNETIDDGMKQALAYRKLKPEGVKHTHIYHLIGRETKNSGHSSVHQFSLKFAELSPYAVMEILELNEAQQTRFLQAYDVTKLVLERLKIYPKTEEDKKNLFYWDELDTGYPEMTLNHLYDIVRMIASHVSKDTDDPYIETQEFFQQKELLKRIIKESKPDSSISSWRKVQGKLGRIKRLGIFDNPDAEPLDYAEMLQTGRVSIIDLNDTESPQINNMVIAQLLRGIQQQQEENYKKAIEESNSPIKTMILIEEAHEFLSAQRIQQMPILFQQVARIAKRGRKRWLGLVFITQLPQHLPNEVFGLINNWILHSIGDDAVVNRLRRSIGGINQGLWNQLPDLAPGQAIVSFTSLSRPLLVAIDPTPCQLLMVD
ncbi:MAG: ATP-binding protein [Microcystaceae cyanobacterium]